MYPYRIALTYETILLARSQEEAESEARCLAAGHTDSPPVRLSVQPLVSQDEIPPDWDLPLTRKDLREEAGRVMERILPRALSKGGSVR